MPRVLVVDDELGIRATLQEFLRDEGYEVETASEVEEAVQRLKVRPFDVIVTDIVMPRASGVDLLKFIHETQPLAQVILITGEPMLDTATQALRAGAFDYLQKPITKQKITGVVGGAARLKIVLDEKARLEDENRRYHKELEAMLNERTRALLESEELHQSLVQNLPCGFAHLRIIRDENGRASALSLVEVNDPFLALTHWSSEDIIGQNLSAFVPNTPAFGELCTRLLANAEEGGALRFRFAARQDKDSYDVVAFPLGKDSLVVVIQPAV